MKYSEMIKEAQAQGKSSESAMWKSVGRVDALLKEQDLLLHLCGIHALIVKHPTNFTLILVQKNVIIK